MSLWLAWLVVGLVWMVIIPVCASEAGDSYLWALCKGSAAVLASVGLVGLFWLFLVACGELFIHYVIN